MITQESFQTAQHRLVQHYLDKLKQAETASRRGHENYTHSLKLVRRDWEQIKRWQAWSVNWKAEDPRRAQLCIAFSLVPPDILRIQLTPAEQLKWAQQALRAARQFHENESERLLLYQVAFISLTIEALDQGEAYAQQLMERAQAAHDSLGMGRAWYILGTASFTRGNFDRSEACYTESIRQFEACHAVEEIPIVWRGMGRVLQFRGDYPQAQTYHQQYLNASAATGNEQGMLDAHVSLSGIFLALRDYLAAEHHAQLALGLARPLGKSRFLAPALFSMAHAQKWLGQYENACVYYEEGIEVARLIASAPSSIANGLYGLGQAKYFQGDYTAALSRFEEALHVAYSANLTFRIFQISNDMVFVHLARGEQVAARARLQEALDIAQKLGTPQFLTKALAASMSLWHHQGNSEQVAVWAGLLKRHTHHLPPSLFNLNLYEHLEWELGAERYHAALERGTALTLENAIPEILLLLQQDHLP